MTVRSIPARFALFTSPLLTRSDNASADDQNQKQMERKRRVLRIAAVTAVTLSAATQGMIIGYLWWTSDPRLSCDRLLYWGEWISCLHGRSHPYITTTELALFVWLIGGIAMFLGRLLPIYLSAVLPGAAMSGFIWIMIKFWNESFKAFAPFGEVGLAGILAYSIVVFILALFLLGPVAEGWLWGLGARVARVEPSEVHVFD
jgi:hypothetical protein